MQRRDSTSYLGTDKAFGLECGYVLEGGPCQLLPYPRTVAFRNLLVLKPIRHVPIPECELPVDAALAALPGFQPGLKCMGDVVRTVDRFEMNVAMPAGIFEIPDYARDVTPVVKVIE